MGPQCLAVGLSIPGPQNEVLESQGLWGGHKEARFSVGSRPEAVVRWAGVSAHLGAVGQPRLACIHLFNVDLFV